MFYSALFIANLLINCKFLILIFLGCLYSLLSDIFLLNDWDKLHTTLQI